nr:replication initiator protein A [Novacetimonas pomaceti]
MGARDYRLLKSALARLQMTVERTTIRNGEHWRRHQFSWIAVRQTLPGYCLAIRCEDRRNLLPF